MAVQSAAADNVESSPNVAPIGASSRMSRIFWCLFWLFLWVVPFVLWICIFYFREVQIVRWPLELSHYPVFRDFVNLWAGAIAALQNQLNSIFDKTLHQAQIGELLGIPPPKLVWSYPPTALLLALPFGLLSYPLAPVVWTCGGLVAYFIAAKGLRVGRQDRLGWLAAILLSPGSIICLAYGQTAFLTSAALITGMSEAHRRPIFSGICFAILAAKPQIAIVVPFALVVSGAWRAFVSTAFFIGLFVAATVLAFGIEGWRLFVDVTVPQQLEILNSENFKACVMMSPYFFFRGLGISLWWSYALQVFIALLAVAIVCASISRERDHNIQILIIACGVLVTSAYMQTYELPLLVAAVARVWAHPESRARFPGSLIHLVLALITMAIPSAMILTPKINAVPVILILFLVWLGRDALSEALGKIRNFFYYSAAFRSARANS